MNSEAKPTSKLIFTSILSGTLTLIFSLVYIGLSAITLIFRFSCELVPLESITPSEFFVNTLYRHYILNADCDSSMSVEAITSDYSVFVFTTLTLTFSVATLVAALALIAVVTSSSETRNLNIIIYGYVGICICSLIVDLSFASHFGMDFTYLTGQLNVTERTDLGAVYLVDLLRLGALLLMSVCMKGYIGHLVNLGLLILLIIYVVEYAQELDKSQHSIHKLGAVKAYERSNQSEMCNHQCEICSQRNKNGRAGSQINYGYSHGEDTPRSRSPGHNSNLKPEYSNSMFDRSNSWQPSASSSRPFSYLEDAKRPTPLTLPPPLPSPSASEPQWRRDRWQSGPPVPAPDYSPHSPRRLKSALKSYM